MDPSTQKRLFRNALSKAEAKMSLFAAAPGGDMPLGESEMSPATIGGVACSVHAAWSADWSADEDGRMVARGHCSVHIWPDDEQPGLNIPYASARLPFAHGGAQPLDPWVHFQEAFAAAQAKLRQSAQYLLLHEADELRRSLPEAPSKPKPGL